MKIDFFETENGMDPRAIGAGVYMVELENEVTGKKICLYVGESVWIASRCGVHLYALKEDHNYFGLEDEDINNENLVLKFSVVETIPEKKSILGRGEYKKIELEVIKNYKPLTQLDTSDKQIGDAIRKNAIVQNELKRQGLK